jgi:hypothetical protein
MNMFPWNRDRQHKMFSPHFDGDRKRYEWVTNTVQAVGTALGAFGSLKQVLTKPPKAPAIPKVEPPAALPSPDPVAASYAQSRRLAVDQKGKGGRTDTFLAGRRRPGAIDTMLG